MTWSPESGTWPSIRTGDWANNKAFTTGIPTHTLGKNCVTDYGADFTGVSNSATAINNALTNSSVGQYAYLPAGTYLITSAINIPSGKSLRGAGMTQTTINHALSSTPINLGDAGSRRISTAKAITGSDKGSTHVHVAGGTSGWAVGDMIAITEVEDNTLVEKDGYNSCTWCGDENGHYVGQFVEITQIDSPSSNSTVTFTPPLWYTYDNSPIGQEYTLSAGAGAEEFKIYYTSGTAESQVGSISGDTTKGAWVRGVHVYYPRGGHIRFDYSHACTVTKCKLERARGYGSDKGYAVWCMDFNSDHYIYNNVMNWCRYGTNFEGGGVGCIVAYNYIRNVREGDEVPWLHAGVGFHGCHPAFVLIEGNMLPTVIADNTMGSNSHGMIFRNYVARESMIDWSITEGRQCIEEEINSQYFSVVGNILGFTDMTGVYEYNSCDENSVYRFGCNEPGGSTHNNNAYNTSYRHHNYDYVNEAIVNNGADDTTLPDSLYLSSKPSWFGSLTWPPVVVEGPTVNDTPAKGFYDTGEWADETGTEGDMHVNIRSPKMSTNPMKTIHRKH